MGNGRGGGRGGEERKKGEIRIAQASVYMQAINPFALSEVGRKVHGAVPRSLISLGERNTEVVSAKTVGDPASSERFLQLSGQEEDRARRGEGEKPTCWPGKSKRKGRCGRVRGGGRLC